MGWPLFSISFVDCRKKAIIKKALFYLLIHAESVLMPCFAQEQLYFPFLPLIPPLIQAYRNKFNCEIIFFFWFFKRVAEDERQNCF